jgi:hypothetical protein
MRAKFNASQMFDLYAQTVKSCDYDFKKYLNHSEEILDLKNDTEKVERIKI